MPRFDPKIAFGCRVRHFRQDKGWSQEYLATVVGLDRSYVGSVERGERNISLENIWRLAIALQIPASELLNWTKS